MSERNIARRSLNGLARLGLLLAVAGVLVTTTGCTTERETAEGTIVYGYAYWVPIVTVLGAIPLAAMGVWGIKNESWRIGIGGAIGAFALLTWFLPACFIDHVTVTDEGFSYRNGLLGSNSGAFTFAQITDIDEEQRGMGRRSQHDLVLQTTTGTERLSLKNSVMGAAAQTIYDRWMISQLTEELMKTVETEPSP